MSPAVSLRCTAAACQAARAGPLRHARAAGVACSRLGARAGLPAPGAAVGSAAPRPRSGVAVRAQQGAEPPREKDNGRPAVRGKTRPQPKVTVSTPTVDRALGDAPPTVEAQNETTALLLLTLVFIIIIVEGLLVASSGFMSEEWDGIVQVRPRRCCAPIAALTRSRGAQNNVLPLFAPTLGLFLLGSSSYGAAAARLAGFARARVPSRARLTRAAGVWKTYGTPK